MEIEDVHKNTKLLIDGVPYNVDEAEFMKPGKGRAIYRLKLRNLLDGATADRTYHSGDSVDEAHTESLEGQYLYREGEHYIFMNTSTFEQLFIVESQIGDKKEFLKEGMVVSILMMSDQPIDVAPPTFAELTVVESDVATKTGTISPQTKSVTLETGYVISVPAFIKEGDVIKVDTRTGTYVERISGKK